MSDRAEHQRDFQDYVALSVVEPAMAKRGADAWAAAGSAERISAIMVECVRVVLFWGERSPKVDPFQVSALLRESLRQAMAA